MADDHQTIIDRNYLLLRRLHSFSGLFPIGAFLFPHLTTNSSIVWGRMLNRSSVPSAALADAGVAPHPGVETFQHEVDFIYDLPALILIEWGVLFLPLLFHAVLGMWFAQTGRSNAARYGYMANQRYTLQRISGYVGVLFIFMHITSLRFGWEYFGLMPAFDRSAASSSTAFHFQQGAWGLAMVAFYLVSVLLLVFHFANGIWTAGITWGLTISAGAQRRWGHVCAAIGVALGLAATAGIVGFATLDIEQARTIEGLIRSSAH